MADTSIRRFELGAKIVALLDLQIHVQNEINKLKEEQIELEKTK